MSGPEVAIITRVINEPDLGLKLQPLYISQLGCFHTPPPGKIRINQEQNDTYYLLGAILNWHRHAHLLHHNLHLGLFNSFSHLQSLITQSFRVLFFKWHPLKILSVRYRIDPTKFIC